MQEPAEMAEARLLADALKTDTHVRVQVAEELSEWMRREENDPEEFPELERLVGALVQWMGSSNHKVKEGEEGWALIGNALFGSPGVCVCVLVWLYQVRTTKLGGSL